MHRESAAIPRLSEEAPCRPRAGPLTIEKLEHAGVPAPARTLEAAHDR